MYRAILLPLDGSAFAEEAFPLAWTLARAAGAELHLVHVIIPSHDVDLKTPQDDLDWRASVRDGAEGYLKDLAARAEAEGVSALTAVLEGPVARTLQDYVDEQGMDLIALTSHGSGGVRRWWLGSVADRLLRGGRSDMLVVRPWDETEDVPKGDARFRRVMVPLDGSELAEAALVPARELAERFGASIVLTRVVPKPLELTSIYGVPGVEVSGGGHASRIREAEAYLARVASDIGSTVASADVVESPGAAEGVVESARSLGADLIVLSSHGRGGVERVVLGSVADKVLRTSTLPVLVVRGDRED